MDRSLRNHCVPPWRRKAGPQVPSVHVLLHLS